MGLDGISINQLRVTQEHNSSELNSLNRVNPNQTHKVIDGLNEGQKIDPDREREKDNQNFFDDFDTDEQNDDNKDEQPEVIIKYDLSESSKYQLKLDELTNTVQIVEISTNNVVQRISAEQLSDYVGFLSNSQGSLVNRKF